MYKILSPPAFTPNLVRFAFTYLANLILELSTQRDTVSDTSAAEYKCPYQKHSDVFLSDLLVQFPVEIDTATAEIKGAFFTTFLLGLNDFCHEFRDLTLDDSVTPAQVKPIIQRRIVKLIDLIPSEAAETLVFFQIISFVLDTTCLKNKAVRQFYKQAQKTIKQLDKHTLFIPDSYMEAAIHFPPLKQSGFVGNRHKFNIQISELSFRNYVEKMPQKSSETLCRKLFSVISSKDYPVEYITLLNDMLGRLIVDYPQQLLPVIILHYPEHAKEAIRQAVSSATSAKDPLSVTPGLIGIMHHIPTCGADDFTAEITRELSDWQERETAQMEVESDIAFCTALFEMNAALYQKGEAKNMKDWEPLDKVFPSCPENYTSKTALQFAELKKQYFQQICPVISQLPLLDTVVNGTNHDSLMPGVIPKLREKLLHPESATAASVALFSIIQDLTSPLIYTDLLTLFKEILFPENKAAHSELSDMAMNTRDLNLLEAITQSQSHFPSDIDATQAHNKFIKLARFFATQPTVTSVRKHTRCVNNSILWDSQSDRSTAIMRRINDFSEPITQYDCCLVFDLIKTLDSFQNKDDLFTLVETVCHRFLRATTRYVNTLEDPSLQDIGIIKKIIEDACYFFNSIKETLATLPRIHHKRIVYITNILDFMQAICSHSLLEEGLAKADVSEKDLSTLLKHALHFKLMPEMDNIQFREENVSILLTSAFKMGRTSSIVLNDSLSNLFPDLLTALVNLDAAFASKKKVFMKTCHTIALLLPHINTEGKKLVNRITLAITALLNSQTPEDRLTIIQGLSLINTSSMKQ